MHDFKGRSLLSKPINPNSPSYPSGGAFQVMAVIAVDGNGTPITFGGGGGGPADWSQAVIRTFTQATPAASWYVYHGMKCKPTVQLITTDGVEGIPDVEWTDNDNLVIKLSKPMAGIAYLNRYPTTVLKNAEGATLTPDLSFANPQALEVLTGDTLVFPPDAPGANDGDIGAWDQSPTS